VTTLSASQVAGYWRAAGGPADRAVEWVAIAGAESSLDTESLSSTGARGLWQIEYYNAVWAHATADELYDPEVNARAAVYGSGGGTNCAAWDTCYYDINATGRYSFLDYPEQHSAAWQWISSVTAALNTGGYTPPVYGYDPDPVAKTGSMFATTVYDVVNNIPRLINNIQLTTQSTAPIYGPGWR